MCPVPKDGGCEDEHIRVGCQGKRRAKKSFSTPRRSSRERKQTVLLTPGTSTEDQAFIARQWGEDIDDDDLMPTEADNSPCPMDDLVSRIEAGEVPFSPDMAR